MRVSKMVLGLLAVLTLAPVLRAAPPEVITYQGQLKKDGIPLNGLVDLKFSLVGNRSGLPQLAIVRDRLAVELSNGLFNVELDFGAAAFSIPRWLEIQVRYPAGSHNAYELIEPRQAITGAPYALHAISANVTLDQAYDSGGAGAGRTITADAGAVTINGPDGLNVSGGITSGPVKISLPANSFDLQVTRGPLLLAGEPSNVSLGGKFLTGSVASPVPHWAYLKVATSVHRLTRDADADLRFAVETAPNSEFAVIDQMTLDNAGNLGIGTSAPVARLHVFGSSDTEPGSGGLLVIGSTTSTNLSFDNNEIMARNNGTVADLALNADGGNVIVAGGGPGNLGVGTTSPKGKLHVNGDYYGRGHLYLYALEGDGASGTAYVQARDDSSTSNIDLRLRSKAGTTAVDVLTCKSNGRVGIGTTAPASLLDVAGTARVNVLTIDGGADLSENFDVRDAQSQEASHDRTDVNQVEAGAAEPGMVVTIDPENPGKLRVATSAYDSTVAGIISGAGGVGTGMVMAHEGTLADGKHPVALTGRVYCKVDASSGAIKPGDLLTTSNTPGHAMKVIDRERAHGAVLGKAMTGLPQGEHGLVLVLVSLQ